MTIVEERFFESGARAFSKFTSNTINWEQRRYEIAKSMMAATVESDCPEIYKRPETTAEKAVVYADALIRRLKETE